MSHLPWARLRVAQSWTLCRLCIGDATSKLLTSHCSARLPGRGGTPSPHCLSSVFPNQAELGNPGSASRPSCGLFRVRGPVLQLGRRSYGFRPQLRAKRLAVHPGGIVVGGNQSARRRCNSRGANGPGIGQARR
jgi:hypothetical protein